MNFRGEHYSLTLMTPFFAPGPIEHPQIPIYIAAVNPYNLRLAGELCDGVHLHPFHSVSTCGSSRCPTSRPGSPGGGRPREAARRWRLGLHGHGPDAEEIAARPRARRTQIAFYASTRTYEPVLAAHGWQDLTPQLHRKSVEGDWAGMAALITDEMLEVFAVEAPLDGLRAALDERYRGLLDRIAPYVALDRRTTAEELRAFATALRTGPDSAPPAAGRSRGETAWSSSSGVALIVLGVVALVYEGITYTTREKVLDIGPLKAEVKHKKTIPLSPVVGVAAVAGGIVLLLVAGRRS